MFLFNPNELFLEISSTEHLFGGEAGLLLKAENFASQFGIQKETVLCDRIEWARALHTQPEVLLPPGKSKEVLWALPLERIVFCGDPQSYPEEAKERESLLIFLRKVGLSTIGDFAKLPSTSINRRFGKMGIQLLEWIQGEKTLLPKPFCIPESLKEVFDTEDATSVESLLFFLRQGLVRLELRLKGRSLSAKTIQLTFHLESGTPLTRKLEVSHPTQESQALLKLLKELLTTLHWDSPLLRLEIEITDSISWSPGQLSLFDKSENNFYDLAQYVTRLRNRLGESQVGFPEFNTSYFPECSWKNIWPPSPHPPTQNFPQRPLFIFSPAKPCPAPKNWELTPSEDISTEWWERNERRSYFLAKNPQGSLLWIYFDRHQREWFLHGVFD